MIYLRRNYGKKVYRNTLRRTVELFRTFRREDLEVVNSAGAVLFAGLAALLRLGEFDEYQLQRSYWSRELAEEDHWIPILDGLERNIAEDVPPTFHDALAAAREEQSEGGA